MRGPGTRPTPSTLARLDGRHSFPPRTQLNERPMTPSSTPPPTAGRFCWHELMTTDPAGAIKFYGKLAGWTAEALPQDPTYQILKARGKMIGGVMELPQQARQMG